jgi:hypothetical protein
MEESMKSLALILVVMALGGCAANPARSAPAPSEGEAESREARLEVRNRTSEDMDVYMVRRDQRVRIGLAPSGRSTFFTLTTGMITGGGPAQFEAVRIRGAGAPVPNVRTEPLSVRRGETVTLDIPPQ